MNEKTKNGEIIEPLGGDMYIVQPQNGYRFGSDAVALAKFASARIKKGQTVIDLCSGCGIVGILTEISTGAAVTGFEIDDSLCDMSMRSAEMNGLSARFIRADIRDLDALSACFPPHTARAVVVNPPYFKADSRAAAVAPSANSEISVTFDDVLSASKLLLRQGGDFYLSFTSSRMDEAMEKCRAAKFIPKELVVNSNGKTFLMRASFGARPGMVVSIKEY